MAVRVLFITLFTFVFAISSRAETPAEMAMKVMRYEQLAKLPRAQQIEYMAGLRSLLVELESKSGSAAAPEKTELNAKIEFLRLFIENAEAMGAGAWQNKPQPKPKTRWVRPQACPSALTKNSGIRAHMVAGGVFRCYPEKVICPHGKSIGQIGRHSVCFDYRNESYSKWRAAEKRLGVASSRSASAPRRPTRTAAERSAATRTAARPSRSTAGSPGRVNSKNKSPEEKTGAEAQTLEAEPNHFTAEADVQNAKTFDAKNRSEDDAIEKLVEGATATALRSRTADERTEDAKADEIIDREVDADGDVHETRRQIANFQVKAQADQVAADSQENRETALKDADQACLDDLPKDSNPPASCTAESKADAMRGLQAKETDHCFAAGNFSHYKNNRIAARNCQPPREFCMNRLTCRKKSGELAPYAQVLFKCTKPNTIICNPYIFNLDKDDQPLCVPNAADATKQCAALAQNDKPFFLATSAPHGVIEGWNEFADEFNKLCFESPSKDYYCAECAIIKFRLSKLNRNVLKKNDREMCNQMIRLRDETHASGAAAPSNTPATSTGRANR